MPLIGFFSKIYLLKHDIKTCNNLPQIWSINVTPKGVILRHAPIQPEYNELQSHMKQYYMLCSRVLYLSLMYLDIYQF